MPAGRKELTSWKEIADYLGVSVRTAQKWEPQRGLPVRRFPGEKGRVSADSETLDRWRESTLQKPHWWASPRLLRWYALALTVLLLVIGAAWVASNRRGLPSQFRLELNSLIVTDAQGRELWRKTFEEPFSPGVSAEGMAESSQYWFGDLDSDGRVELLFTCNPKSRQKNGSFLICFSDQGKEKWRFVPGRQVSTPTETFPPPFLIGRLAVASLGKNQGKSVVVSSHHLSWYPSQVVALSATGAVQGEYWHSGHITSLDLADLDGDGAEEILLGGISNGYHTATLVVLDPRNLGGASPEENPDYQLQGFPPGREKARILFPRSCINRKFHEYNWTASVDFSGDRIKIGVREREDDLYAGIVYYLDRRLSLIGLEFSDRLRAVHRELEAAGQLDHPLTDQEINELRNIRYLKRPNW